ncbi:hypothetical protein L1049_015172 [Liquidambar formosana]|uniref:Potassium channel n=1 Tax=Liquidambar formosana TaxID=63359 RepID=A0AAP0RYL2_LIQFO
MQNEAPVDVYIIVSGEVEIIDCKVEKEQVIGTLQSGDMFGEVGALCCKPQCFTFRTKTLSQLLRLKTSDLIESMQRKREDNVAILKNFLQHHKNLKDLSIEDLMVETGEEDRYVAIVISMVVVVVNAAVVIVIVAVVVIFVVVGFCCYDGDDERLIVMNQHIAASKGHEDCVLVLIKHECNIHLRAAKRNDLMVMKGLLKNGLNVNSKDHHGLTAIQIALAENHVDMVKLLVMNGADVFNVNTYNFSSTTLNEMLKKRDVGYRIMLDDTTPDEVLLSKNEEERDCNRERPNGLSCPRVSIYRGHPLVRRDTCCVEAGRLIRLPNTLDEIKSIAGEKFGFDARNAMVTNEEGAEIDSIEVIRDNDKIFIAEDPNTLRATEHVLDVEFWVKFEV